MTQSSSPSPETLRAFAQHTRTWQQNRYVYPVVSRRAKGISIGINLTPDKTCNFNCLYCCVDRSPPFAFTQHKPGGGVELPTLRAELTAMLALINSGVLYTVDPFDKIPPELRRINDIALSGDAEPTACPNFPEVCHLVTDFTKNTPTKLVIITNATLFQQLKVKAALTWLSTNNKNAEVWAKLDAGSDAYYHLINRTSVSFSRVLGNILWYSQIRPITIQSLFMNVFNRPPTADEINAYIARLSAILAAKGKIQLVQLYTIARKTNEAFVTPLSEAELQSIAARVRAAIPTLPVEVYP